MTNYIDIRKEISGSDSAFLKHLPGFIISILKKIIHQDEMNALLNKFADLSTAEFLNAMLKEMRIQVQIKGTENLPEQSKCFFVANHPFGIADGLILTHIVTEKYGEFRSIGNNVFLLIPQLRPAIAAVNVFGSERREYLKELDKVYCSELPITHFPAGIVSRTIKGKVQDSEWQKSMITKAVSCKRDIVPLFFDGKNSNLFYAIYRIRKAIGLNLNIELMLLPREFFNKKGKTITVSIGKKIPCTHFDKSKTPKEWTAWLKKETYELKANGNS